MGLVCWCVVMRRNLHHLGFIGMRCYPSHLNTTPFEMNKEQHVVSDQTEQCEHFHGEEVGPSVNVHVGAKKSLSTSSTVFSPERAIYRCDGGCFPLSHPIVYSPDWPVRLQFDRSPSRHLAIRTTSSSRSGSMRGRPGYLRDLNHQTHLRQAFDTSLESCLARQR